MKFKIYTLISVVLSFFGCIPQDDNLKDYDYLFTEVSSDHSGIIFQNQIKENLYFNFLNYSYIYNGGGVAAGDINNDGLIDLYFTANQGSDKLYLNQGNFVFDDITQSSGILNNTGWTTGVTMIDINTDGYLDIYVCKSGSLQNNDERKNLLFINKQNGTFKEEAEKWGLNDNGFSTQAYFIDYDMDSDLDMYLVNHRADFQNNNLIENRNDKLIIPEFTDRLYRNDIGKFTDVTSKAGLENSSWGLSASIGDFNHDTLPDIYVCNDFLAPDFLYINNGNGTFSNKIAKTFDHLSQNSMGSDFADINNDGNFDLMVAEMSPEDHVRGKTNMPSMSTENFDRMVNANYHYQYMTNTLQLNQKNGVYSEIAQMAGVAKTDWSWSPLLADFDNDGLNDLFITNGILKDLSNSDYRNKIKKRIKSRKKMTLDEAIAMLPSNPISNYLYKNEGNITFSNHSKKWGIDKKTFSNGSAYADLDNDGDLDLIVNNLSETAQLYKNNTTHRGVNVNLIGPPLNPNALGAIVKIHSSSTIQTKQQYFGRGYLSSSTPVLHFGFSKTNTIKRIEVIWPDKRVNLLEKLLYKTEFTLDYAESEIAKNEPAIKKQAWLTKIDMTSIGLNFKHQENVYNDFNKQLLLPYRLSRNGPFISSADVNNDGLKDVFIGGASNQSGQLYIQKESGQFKQLDGPWGKDFQQEDMESQFVDYDSDGDMDLYVVHGGYEFEEESDMLLDKMYENLGNGNFRLTTDVLPNIKLNGKVVEFADTDNDGDLDMFLAGRLVSGKYPFSPKSYIVTNVNGKYIYDPNQKLLPTETLGMVTDAIFSDFDADGDQDLIVVGEWAPIQILENKKGIFNVLNSPELERSRGIWFNISKYDIDNDGDDDYFLGNLGLNSKFKSGYGKEFHIFADDFDNNGSSDIVLTNMFNNNLVPVRGLECSSQQIPGIQKKFTSYESFANANLIDIYGDKKLATALHYQVDILESVFLKNNGNGHFEIEILPNEAQIAPVMDFEFCDINNDGSIEIFVVGNLYSTEVETIRYDASKGLVLNYANDTFKKLNFSETGFIFSGDARDIEINQDSDTLIIVSNNNDSLTVFKKK